MSIQDKKKERFTPSKTNIADAEFAWLGTQGATGNNTPERWMDYLADQGYTTGPLSERMFRWLGSLGHEGSLSDRYSKWLDTPAVPLTGFLSLEGVETGFLSLEGTETGSLSLEGNE